MDGLAGLFFKLPEEADARIITAFRLNHPFAGSVHVQCEFFEFGPLALSKTHRLIEVQGKHALFGHRRRANCFLWFEADQPFEIIQSHARPL